MKDVQFKVGDLVWCPNAGFVTLGGALHEKYPLCAESEVFTLCGRSYFMDKHRTLLTPEEAELLGHKRPKEKRYGFVYLSTSLRRTFMITSLSKEILERERENFASGKTDSVWLVEFEYEL